MDDVILIIDDEKLIRELSSGILVGEGYRVLTSADSSEGLRLMKDNSVGVVLLDIMMPEISGLDTLKILNDTAPDVPVIMITAHSSQASVIDALKHGAYDFLPKPFKAADLLHAVSRAMERHRLARENRALIGDLQEKVTELTELKSVAEDFARQLEERVKEQTMELLRSKQLTENIISNMASGLLVVNLIGQVTMINRQGEEFLRIPRERLLGQRFLDLFPGAQELLAVRPEIFTRELALQLPDGSVIPLGFGNSYLLDPRGVREGIIVVFRDLREIKKLQEEIRRKDRLATIGEVAAGVAHEIRNPLFGISSVAQILSREVTFSPTHGELVNAMLAEIRRLNVLVEDLLLYGRPSQLTRRPEDLHQIWDEILGLHRDQTEERTVTITRQFDPHLPLVPVDGNKIRQVFLNLLKNALEATPPGGAITLRTRRVETGHKISPCVEVSVADTGTGIPAEQVEKIFDLFFTTKSSGSGLGLPLSRRIVEDHGGTLTVASALGKGSLFTLHLPLSETPLSAR